MSTTTTTTSSSAARTSSLATSVKFKTFAFVFAASFPVLYVICDIFNLPLFTFHPATNRVDLSWAAGRSGEGPAMYWYGWTASCLLGSAILGGLAALLPGNLTKKLPLALVWILPLVAIPFLVWSLRPFWEKGGWW